MFNKEDSRKNISCNILNKIDFKRVGSALLTLSLCNSLTPVKAEDNYYHQKMYDYSKKVEEYMNEKEYDLDFFKLYHTGRFIINGEEIDKNRVFIIVGKDNNELKLDFYTASIGKIDFLTGKDIDYEIITIVPFIQTTLFKILLDNDLITVKDGRYMSFDMEKVNEIIDKLNNWDGMAHSLVPETDAYDNKVFIEKDEVRKYEK